MNFIEAVKYNRHYQTIYPALFRKVPQRPKELRLIETPDDDRLQVFLPHERQSDELVILSHGMEGDANAGYIVGLDHYLTEKGYDVLTWNMRNCGANPHPTHEVYHGGKSEDLETITLFAESLDYKSISLVGFSLGGILTLNYLGRERHTKPNSLKKAVAVSTPLCLETCVKRLDSPKNYHYSLFFLRTCYAKYKKLYKQFPEKLLPVPPLRKFRTLRSMDRHLTAPLLGMEDENEFYRTHSAKNVVNEIKHQTLIINALDDPFLGQESLYDIPNPNISMMRPHKGGHVGFLNPSSDRYESEDMIYQFIQS